jgi:hypothetical protein
MTILYQWRWSFFRDLRAGQSTSVGGITFGCDDATEPAGETPQPHL